MQLTVDSGQLPVGWVIKKLGDVCNFQGGSQPPKSIFSSVCKENYVRLIQIRDYKSDNHIIFIPKDKARRFCTKEDVMIGRYGPPVFQILRGLEGAYNVALMKATPDESQLLKDFLFHFLKTPKVQNYVINLSARAAGQSGLNKATIEPYLIPLPPLPEQKWIVAILDEVFEGIDRAIANTEKNLANSRELFESYLNVIFTQKGDGWEEKTLKQVSIQFGRGKSRHRPRNDKKLYGGKYPFIQTGDIRNSNHIVTSYSQTYNEVGLAQSKLWAKGTVCITIAANIAETGVLDFDACIPDSVIGLVVDQNKANNMFIEYMLQAFKLFLKAKGKGSAQDNINMGTFEAQTFPFPSIDEQERIVSKLDFLSTETQRLETIYRQKIATLKQLKQSILQKAFTGELTADTAKTAKEGIAA